LENNEAVETNETIEVNKEVEVEKGEKKKEEAATI
jgi:hypothetical protein